MQLVVLEKVLEPIEFKEFEPFTEEEKSQDLYRTLISHPNKNIKPVYHFYHGMGHSVVIIRDSIDAPHYLFVGGADGYQCLDSYISYMLYNFDQAELNIPLRPNDLISFYAPVMKPPVMRFYQDMLNEPGIIERLDEEIYEIFVKRWNENLNEFVADEPSKPENPENVSESDANDMNCARLAIFFMVFFFGFIFIYAMSDI